MAEQLPVTCLYEDDELMIRWLPGTTDRLVLVFTGVKHRMGGMPMDEFIGTSSDGARNHVCFISDMMRSWYSRAGLTDKITAQIRAFCETRGINDMVAVGNSMGGYGAVRFASELPIRTVAAFSPQVSMDPAVIREDRWAEYRRFFGSELLPSLEGPIRKSRAQIYMVFGQDHPGDMAHAGLLPDVPNLHVTRIGGCDHTLVNELKKRNYASPAVKAMLDGNTAEVERLFAAFQSEVSTWKNRLLCRLRHAKTRVAGWIPNRHGAPRQQTDMNNDIRT